MHGWKDLPLSVPPPPGSPRLLLWPKLRSRELQNYRDIIVALPPSYDHADRRYAVVVMHDGQNLFVPETSHAGDWGLGATLGELAREGTEAIIVGIANTGPFRKYEYSPFRDPAHGGGDGDRYLDFIMGSVLPLVRNSFRTSAETSETVIAGSSMGGLVSLYAWWQFPGVFGAAAAMSPSAWFAGEAMRKLIETAGSAPAGRLWLDIGTAEGDPALDAVRRLRVALVGRGLESDRFHYLEDPDATHHESHWGRRFRQAFGECDWHHSQAVLAARRARVPG